MLVTVSRQLGSEGGLIAQRVATELNLLLIDRDFVTGLGKSAGIPPEMLGKLLYEGRRSLAYDIVETLGKAPAVPSGRNLAAQSPLSGVFAPLLGPEQVGREDAAQALGAIIRDLVSRRDVLVLGQGGQVLLHDVAGACHVQLIAPMALRVQRVAAADGVTPRTAKRRIRASDQARSDYIARFYGVNWLDPLLYHIVINIGQTPADAAVAVIVEAAKVLDQTGRTPRTPSDR